MSGPVSEESAMSSPRNESETSSPVSEELETSAPVSDARRTLELSTASAARSRLPTGLAESFPATTELCVDSAAFTSPSTMSVEKTVSAA